MAWFFGDSFDFYASVNDATLNYWDGGGVGSGNYLLATGRFAGSRCIATSFGQVLLTKSSGANDTIHHFIFAFLQTAALSGSTLGMYLQLLDGTTGQCCIVFRSDGAMLLTSGTPAGTVLATYTGAVSAPNAWTAFEVEVVINNTTGSITVRKNGNTGTPDFTLGSLNTRVSANNYANKLTVGMQASITQHQLDDLLWRSDPTSVAWLGDIRAYQQMPSGVDISDQFTGVPNPSTVTLGTTFQTSARASGSGVLIPFTAPYSGTISSGAILGITIGGTGNIKCAIYDGAHINVLGTSNAIVNPGVGSATITFPTPVPVVKGTSYYLAIDQDFAYTCQSANSGGIIMTTAYASFPATNPTTSSAANATFASLLVVPTNSSLVSEAQEDGVTSYVYDSTVGHNDLYAMTPLASTPQSIVAVTMRGFMAKSDAGTRAGQLQFKSGGTTVQSAPLFLSTNFLWNYRTDTVDPNTGLAWTAAAVNAAQIGPVVENLMAYIFGDSFDFYAAITDANGWWDSSANSWSLAAGRFSNSQAFVNNSGANSVFLVKSSGSNDATHHIVCSYLQTVGLAANTAGGAIQLSDGATAQCSIVFRADGSIVLTSGAPGGTVLATYNGAFIPNVWAAFEFEVTVNNTTGVFMARKDGATSANFTATGFNSRGGTANNYANRLTVLNFANPAAGAIRIDDLLCLSITGAAPNTWVGDVRAYQLMPTSDASVQFSQNTTNVPLTPYVSASGNTSGINLAIGAAFVPSQSGTIGSATVSLQAGATGNMRAAIYDSTRTTVLATSNAVVNPTTGINTLTFPTPLAVTRGATYFFAIDQSVAINYSTTNSNPAYYSATITYASFPTASPGFTQASGFIPGFTLNITPTNSTLVSDTTQDGTATYVYDSTVGHADLYNVADLPANTLSIVAMTTRAYMEKSDAGARTGRVQLKSGATTVTGDLVLSSSFSWCSRTDTVDPNTSAAWTLANANAAQAGVVVAA